MKQPIDIKKIRQARDALQSAPLRADLTTEILSISDETVAELLGPGASVEAHPKQPGDTVQ